MILSLTASLSLAAAVEPVPKPSCGAGSKDEVVVCGERAGPNPYRLPRLPEKYDRKQFRAETDMIPGVHTRAHVDGQTMPDGTRSNRMMITFSMPF